LAIRKIDAAFRKQSPETSWLEIEDGEGYLRLLAE
jgi:hypothetical protein